MKKFIFAFLIVAVMAGTAFGFSNSGEYMFTHDGNDSNTSLSDLEQLIENWFLNEKSTVIDVELAFYAKVDAPSTTTTEGSGGLTLSYETDSKSGEWWTNDAIEFYTVKAGNQFAFYWVDPSATYGTWSTDPLLVGAGNQPTISHFSTWRTVGGGTPPDNPVPEPGTVLLLGLGLAGIAGARKLTRKN